MRFSIITLFPELFDSFLQASLIGKALAAGTLRLDFVDPRDFATDRHRTVDDAPFGGGEGMVLKPEPLVAAAESVQSEGGGAPYRVLLTPDGAPLDQSRLKELAAKEHLAVICGRYEGFDERIRKVADVEISLGDFVLNGGEVAAMAIVDGVSRLVPGVIGNAASLEQESHEDGLLEYPQYTRPRDFRGEQVPEVLIGGNHEGIRRWRQGQRLIRTRQRRPDLWARYQRTPQDRDLLGESSSDGSPSDGKSSVGAGRMYLSLVHHPVHDREGAVVTTALTNLDLHDIARCSRTFGLAGYFVVTPLESQQQLARRIVSHWQEGHGARYHQRRAEALALVDVAVDVDEVLRRVEQAEGCRPLVVVTSANPAAGQLSCEEFRDQGLGGDRPVVLLFGTGWGIAEPLMSRADLRLAPVRGPTDYNHLSVRAAAAIILDRLLGLRE